jgi:aminoglycoside/choline kinase family phosphotransferase
VQTRYLLLVPHPGTDQILISHTASSVSLPTATQDDACFWQCVDHVNALAYTRFDIHVRTRRCISVEHDEASTILTKSYLLELLVLPAALPQGTGWLALDAALDQLPAVECAMVAAWRDWQHVASPWRPPWYKPGWMPQVDAWLRQQLGSQVSVRQLRSWQRSAIVRATVAEQHFFFKAVPSVFAHEPALSTWLAAQSPGSVPVVHAVQPEQGWLLLSEAGGTPVDVQPNLERWSKALQQYAELQVATVSHAAALTRMGLPDRSGTWLDDGLNQLLADEAALLVNQPGGLSSDEVERLRDQATELHQRCVELLACGIPTALEHGDFGPWQVLADADRFTFLDWSDAALANPLFSLASFLMDLPELLASPQAREQLVAAYLAPWEAVVPRSILKEAWSLSQGLSGLYSALIYHREVLPQMEVRWEMERMLPYFAHKLLPR